ncbi:Solute carrier family 41 member 1, partial [Paramuricea clavata]
LGGGLKRGGPWSSVDISKCGGPVQYYTISCRDISNVVVQCSVDISNVVVQYISNVVVQYISNVVVQFKLRQLSSGEISGVLLLLTADWLVHFIWKRGSDPDNVAIPYLTALGDLLGTGFLAVAFHILWLVGDRDSDVGD